MSNIETWNKIVDIYEVNKRAEEFKLQDLWTTIFKELFNYSSLNNEIDTHRVIHLGSYDRIIPDIILRKNNEDVAIVELKRNVPLTNNYKNQLLSYLKQLKLNIGILICNKIYLLLYDYTKKDSEQKEFEIDIVKNNLSGEKFVEIFNKFNFELNLVKDFIENNLKIKDDLIQLKNITTEEFIKELLVNYFKEGGFNKLAIDNFIKSIHIDIGPKKEEIAESVKYMQRENVKPYNNISVSKSYNLDKNKAIRICQQNNIKITRCVTFSNLSNSNGKYPANVSLSYLENDWMIILNDGFNRKLHVFNIPAKTFTYKQFYIRQDKNLIVLGIDNNFVDFHPQQNIINRLFEYKIQTIDYSNQEI